MFFEVHGDRLRSVFGTLHHSLSAHWLCVVIVTSKDFASTKDGDIWLGGRILVEDTRCYVDVDEQLLIKRQALITGAGAPLAAMFDDIFGLIFHQNTLLQICTHRSFEGVGPFSSNF